MKLHGKQFVLGPRPVQATADWIHSFLPGTGYLSRCPGLRSQFVRDCDGVAWCLLGVALGTPDPATQVAATATGQVPSVYRSWSGRWVLIGGGQVHMDAAGLLGVYYRGQWASSSAALLSQDERPDCGLLAPESEMDYFPPPLTRFSSLRRLLASQVWHVDGRVSARRLLSDAPPRAYGTILDTIEEHLSNAVCAAAGFGALCVPLTSGYDSRLVLAATVNAGLPARTYTQEYAEMTHADRVLPPRLAAALGLEHTFIEPAALDTQRYKLFDEHSSGHVMGTDREFIARHQWDWCEETDMILRGGCFEVGRRGWFFLGCPSFEEQIDVDAVLRSHREEDTCKRAALKEWARWLADHPEPTDWRDRFYWEVRVGGWLSAVEHSLDLLPASRGCIANSHRFYELVLQLPDEVRASSQHHVDLIKRLAPRLGEFPYNRHD